MAAFIGGIQSKICQVLENLVKSYFTYNSYPEGYHTKIKLKPLNTANRTEGRADAEFLAKYRLGDPNECRKKIGQEGLDAETWKESAARWALIHEAKIIPDQTKSVSANLSKEDLPEKVVRIKTRHELGDGLEAQLMSLIDQAEKDIIKAVRE